MLMGLLTGTGRIGRLNFLVVAVTVSVASVAVFLLTSGIDEVTGQLRVHPAALFAGLAATWIQYTNAIRRLHDCGRSGWLVLLSFVPIISAGLGLYLLFVRGDEVPNGYGPPPGSGRSTALDARLEQLERMQAEAATGASDPGAGYLNPDGTFNMDGLALENAGLRPSGPAEPSPT